MKKLPKISTVRNKADALLTPIVKAIYPHCMLCPNQTEVAHHHVHKSKSTVLRYDLANLIPLCHMCHIRLHHNESFEASKIVRMKGLEWVDYLTSRKNDIVKADVHWFMGQHEKLKELHKQVCG